MVFIIPEGLFEPMVMFFGLINLPATFQVIMNELLRDLINMGKVVVFIDDVIVGTEEERHDELVAKVIKRLEENNLYVKPEKCKWKVREIGFLEVVIEPESIKTKEKEGERCFGLADTEVCQGYSEVLGIGKLLSLIHSELCIHSKTII